MGLIIEILFSLVVIVGVAFLLYRGVRTLIEIVKRKPDCHC